MVNAHCHLELSYLKGRIPRGCGFAGFADAISEVRNETPPEQRARAARYQDARMYNEGITAVGDICNGNSTFALKRESAIRYHNFIEFFGLAETDFSRIEAVAEEARVQGLLCSETPHSTYSLQDGPLRETAAKGDPLSIHFMESPGEMQLFAAEGPLYERNLRMGVSPDFLRYGSPAGRITASVPEKKNILLVHNTFASQEDILAIENHFTGTVTWVLCPRSNAYIENAVPPVSVLRQANVRIAVGTDSLSSNDSLSLIEELKTFRDIPLEELFRWATLNGAEALGIDSWAGSFVPGKRPGAVLVSGIDWEQRRLGPEARSRRIV